MEIKKSFEECIDEGEAKINGTMVECLSKKRCSNKLYFGFSAFCKQSIPKEKNS